MSAGKVMVAVLTAVGLLLGGVYAWGDESEPLRYVNLGDSYGAGSGIQPANPTAPPPCGQSLLNWGHDIAKDRGYQLTDVSCGGAKTENFRTSQYPGMPPQLDAVTPDTDLVTVSIGGNDNDVYLRAFAECVALGVGSGGVGNPCERSIGAELLDKVVNSTLPNVTQALRDVRQKAPKARVAISGYLQILSEKGCFPVMPVAQGDVAFLNRLEATLNDAVKQAAERTGVTYLDVTSLSKGHDACQPVGVRWLEPVVPINAAPVHPNAVGERKMAENAIAKLGLASS